MPPLTKSRYRLGLECPTKIHYSNHPGYHNTDSGNEFLKSLAEGGFQVAELSKLMFPGHLVETLKREESLDETARLVADEHTTVHEAAFSHGDFFIRADILVKNGNKVDLIEVKSKSYDEEDASKAFITSRNEVRSPWLPYVHDVAFQTLVVRLAHPEWEVTPHLLLVNKTARAPIDGINSLFVCRRDEKGNPVVSIPRGVPDIVLKSELLKKHDVSEAVEKLLQADYDGETFAQRAKRWAKSSVSGFKIDSKIEATKCAKCQFRANADQQANGILSGFHECWKAATGLNEAKLDSPLVLNIWNYRKKHDLVAQGIFLLKDVDPETQILDGNGAAPASGWSNAERQRIQVRCVREGNHSTPVVDVDGLRNVMAQLTYPLHFIDFETTRCALPFHEGESPYGNVAFQFSHHIVEVDGSLRHANEWICLDRGVQPNERFAEALRKAVGQDQGTIFHYAAHERTVLADIANGLESASGRARNADLAQWIRSILLPCDQGGRMVDMKEILQRHYYHPLTKGSNSLKAVLPSILKTSIYLQKNYSVPVYGTPVMQSINFKSKTWITPQSFDPYASLPKMETVHSEDRFFSDDSIRDGGAAMIAYAKCQFSEISPEEVASIEAALLKYCELDTLAMVMLWQTWKYDHGA